MSTASCIDIVVLISAVVGPDGRLTTAPEKAMSHLVWWREVEKRVERDDGNKSISSLLLFSDDIPSEVDSGVISVENTLEAMERPAPDVRDKAILRVWLRHLLSPHHRPRPLC